MLGVTNLTTGTYNLHLSPADTLTILLAGWSNLQVVTNGQAYFDNLEIIVSTTPPTPPVLSLSRSNQVSWITISGPAGSRFALEYQTGLAPTSNWIALSTNTLTVAPLSVSDIPAAGNAVRFYRARWVP